MRKFLLLCAAWAATEASARAQVCETMLAQKVAKVVASAQSAGDFKVGAIVGVVTPGCSGVYYFGTTTPGGSAAPDGNTAFRIGSMSKSYTGTLLAYYAHQGKVTVPACRGATTPPPVSLLPATTLQWLLDKVSPGAFPLRGWRSGITLEQLATHTSGLPRKPTWDITGLTSLFESVTHEGAFAPSSGGDNTDTTWTAECPPPPDAGVIGCFGSLIAPSCGLPSQCYPTSPPGANYVYSNYGYGVLGQALANGLDKTSYITAVDNYVLGPLGMSNTFVDGQSRSGLKAMGWSCKTPSGAPPDAALTCASDTEPCPSTVNPAGGFWSTGPDQQQFLKYMMGTGATPASQTLYSNGVRAFAQCDHDGGGQGLGFDSESRSGDTLISKAGDYRGYHSYIGYMQSAGTGAFVMINSNDSAAHVFYDLIDAL